MTFSDAINRNYLVYGKIREKPKLRVDTIKQLDFIRIKGEKREVEFDPKEEYEFKNNK